MIEANNRARAFCAQYAPTPSPKGWIKENSDGTKTVTYECVKAETVTSPPPPTLSFIYSTDTELLQAIQSADTYCAQIGQTASSRIVTNPDGTRTLTFRRISR